MTDVFDHPWLGGLFGDDAVNAIWAPDQQISHMLAFEAAYSRALGVVGLVDGDIAARAVAHILAFRPDQAELRKGSASDGLPVPALVRQLRAKAGEVAIAIHKGTTSQDVIDTALALSIKATSAVLRSRLEEFERNLAQLDDRFGAGRMMARTRMQAALPIKVADRISSWRTPMRDHLDRLRDLRPRVERLQLGGAVGDRQEMAGLGAEMARLMAGELGLGTPSRAWHTTRDGVAEYAAFLSLVSGSLGKIGQDICLMAQQGIDEIALSDGGNSSAMPHKQNPILAELLVTLARFNAVQVGGLHQALIHEQERSGSAWSLEWMLLPQMAVATARSLSAGLSLVGKITAMGNAAS